MTNLNLPDVRIFLCATPVKMYYRFNTLMGLAQTVFDQDPLSGHLFLFFNRDRNRVKILFWDQDGFCIWYKRLGAGTFQFPDAASEQQGIERSYSQLTGILGGFDLRHGRRRRGRYRIVG